MYLLDLIIIYDIMKLLGGMIMGYLFTIIAGFTLSLFIITIFSGLILYILGSLGLMQITDKLGSKGAWMAWLPLFNVYLLGKLAFNKGIGWILVILTILSGDMKKTVNIDGITYVKTHTSSLFSLILAIMTFVVLHKIYKKFSTKANLMTLFTVLSCGILAPIFLFAIRNNEVIE